jgi:hypothetical protein
VGSVKNAHYKGRTEPRHEHLNSPHAALSALRCSYLAYASAVLGSLFRPALRWLLLGQGLLYKVFPVSLEFQPIRLGAGSGLFLRMVRVAHRLLLSVHES